MTALLLAALVACASGGVRGCSGPRWSMRGGACDDRRDHLRPGAGEVRAVTRVLLTSSWMAVAALALRDDSSTAPTIHPPRTSAPTFSDATPCDATLTIDTSAAPAWPTQPVRLNRRERRARRFAR